MDDEKLFSKHYSTDTNRHKDKEEFRGRVLKSIEDIVNIDSNVNGSKLSRLCRSEGPFDLSNFSTPARTYYEIEKTFNSPDEPRDVEDILDFITLVYLSAKDVYRDVFLKKINRIFREESMRYVLNDNGRVRYYPDEEFQKLTKCTLTYLSSQKYSNNLNTFNDVLDDFYRNRNKESPIQNLFHCLEVFVLSIIKDGNYKILKEASIDKLMEIITKEIQQNCAYKEHDKEALANVSNIFFKWTRMCNKYRHGKQEQENKNVPPEIFNYIFSTGISIFRFLLEIDNKYTVVT